MAITENLVTFLTTNPAISAIAGSRVYPHRLPKDATLPAITYQRISTPRVRNLSGSSNLAAPSFYIKSFAATLSAARNLADTIRTQIDGKNIGDRSFVIVENDLDLDDPDTGLFQSVLTVKIWHDE